MKHRGNSKRVPEERNREKYEDVKAENRKLRKQVQTLRKEISRMKNRDEDLQEIIRDFEEEMPTINHEDIKFKCPKCKSINVTVMKEVRPGVDYFSCESCSARGPIK